MTRTLGLITATFALALIPAAKPARAFSTGAGSCDSVQLPHTVVPTFGNGGFVFSAAAAYVPGSNVTVTLTGTVGFKGILLYTVDDTAARVGEW